MLQEKFTAFKRRLGVYKFLPLFFFLGAGIELFMIKFRIGKETFCKWSSSVRKWALFVSESVTKIVV